MSSLLPSLLESISDPSDWPDSLATLGPLDESLRCGLCKDIFIAPVAIRSCHHMFCSTCIRTHINQPSNSGNFCPSCRQSRAFDSELVVIPSLERTAEAWRKARSSILQLYRQKNTKHLSKRNSNDIVNNNDDDDEPRRSKRIRTSNTTTQSIEVIHLSSGGEEEEEEGEEKVDGDQDYHETTTKAEKQKPESQLKPQDLVSCPICGHTFTMMALNTHLDRMNCSPGCPEPLAAERGIRTTTTSHNHASSSSSFLSRPNATTQKQLKKLVRPQYSLKSERELRTLLSDLGIPTNGDKDRLIDRHRQYLNLYNGNVDSSPEYRKTIFALKKTLADWEKSKYHSMNSTVMSEKKQKTWLTDNKQQYDDLIKKARESAMRDRVKKHPTAEADPHPTDQQESLQTNQQDVDPSQEHVQVTTPR